MNYKLLFLFTLILTIGLQAQNALPIGSWRTHFPQRKGTYVTQSQDQLFYATSGAVMVLDKDEIAPRFISKTEGLSNVDIDILQYHQPTETLLIVYSSGILDLLRRDGSVVTVNSITNFTNIVGEKRINQVFVGDNNILFFATTFGVSAFDIERGIFPFTTFMGELNVRSVAMFENYIYAGTEEGIYRVQITNPTIDDFATWEFVGSANGFPSDYSSQAMAVYQDQLYVGVNEDIYRWEDGRGVLFSDRAFGHNLLFMSAEGEHLLVGYRCNIGTVCGGGRVYYYSADGTDGTLAEDCLEDMRNAIEDQRGRVWFGDLEPDFRYLESVTDPMCRRFDFNEQGPLSSLAWDLSMENGELWVATGALSATDSPIFFDDGLAQFSGGSWRIFNRATNETFRGPNPDPNVRDDDVFTMVDVENNTVTNRIYGASYYAGLIEIDGETTRLFNENNSPLRTTTGDNVRTRVSGLKADEEGNLWVCNYQPIGNGSALHRLAPDGTWVSFPNTGGAEELFQIDIDRSGFKWAIDGSNSRGVLVYDEGDINNPNDDRRHVFTAANSNLPTNETNCLVVDNDGDVWVGTNAGIIIFECGSAAFDDNCQGSLRIVELDGFLEFLFKTQSIISLAVDGANRKWVGTARNGVYLISEDGRENLVNFTESNSPLPNNTVRSLAVDQTTGEVFMGTEGGLVSYQGDAIVGTRVNTNQVQVFPNPVRPEYNGPIAIRGLSVNANVKITDVNGKLVNEFNALGGQAIWDGRDYNGRRVQTGVYLVFASTNPREAGALAQPDGVVAKVVFVN